MFKLEPINLSDVRRFLNTCGYYPQLTKLFVQVTTHHLLFHCLHCVSICYCLTILSVRVEPMLV